MALSTEEANRLLTPSPEEQTKLILQGKCPHNQGWTYDGHGHNSDWFRCPKCGENKEW